MTRTATALKRLVVAVALAAALPVLAAEVPITFRPSSSPPAADIPRDSRDAGTVPDPDAAKGGPAGVTFRIVRDLRDYGAFSSVAAPGIRALGITWWDAALFGSEARVETFLRRLASVPRGSTVTHVPWAQMLGVPSVVAEVDHAAGTRGTWHVWYAWPSVYSVYRDGGGRWWFGYWMEVEPLRLNR